MQSARARWAFASTTTSQWPRWLRASNGALSAFLFWTGTCITVSYRAAGSSDCLIMELCKGLCLYNTVAVAAVLVWTSKVFQIEIALVLLTGNGIEHILFDRSDIMYISLHRYVQKQHLCSCISQPTGHRTCASPHGSQSASIVCLSHHLAYHSGSLKTPELCRGNGFYPGTGEVVDIGRGAGAGFNLNIPWQRGGHTDADYIAAFDLVGCPCHLPDHAHWEDFYRLAPADAALWHVVTSHHAEVPSAMTQVHHDAPSSTAHEVDAMRQRKSCK